LETIAAIIIGVIAIVMLGILLRNIFFLEKRITEQDIREELRLQADKLQRSIESEIKESRQETHKYITDSFRSLADILAGSQKQIAEIQDKRLSDLNQQLNQKNDTLQKTVSDMLKHINDIMESRLIAIQRDNEK